MKNAAGYSMCWSSQCVLTNFVSFLSFPFFVFLILSRFKWLLSVKCLPRVGRGWEMRFVFQAETYEIFAGPWKARRGFGFHTARTGV